MRRVLLLGASGSIGSQTLDVLEREPLSFELIGFSVGHQIDKIPVILSRFPNVKAVSLLPNDGAKELERRFPNVRFFVGEEAALELIAFVDADMAVNAIVGFAGLAPSLAVLDRGWILCLANKESLVVGGSFIRKRLSKGKGKLYPIDSEHVAIAKCLSSVPLDAVDRILLTGSGGSFRSLPREALADVTPEMALKHPTWHMGARITIDSATMMNKGFEMIEASELFDFPLSRIQIVLHDESVFHSGLFLKDRTILGEVCPPDMHGPISYALHEGKDRSNLVHVKSLDELKGLHFHPFIESRYPAVSLAKRAMTMPLGARAALNAADEEAVSLFLKREIPFLAIEPLIEKALDSFDMSVQSEQDLARVDEKARECVHTWKDKHGLA